MEIAHENTFKNAIFSNGCNLFLGAGFSILAKNASGQRLPCGDELKKNIEDTHDLGISGAQLKLPLDKLSELANKKEPKIFRKLLEKTYTVNWFDDKYKILSCLSIKTIFTTNIDNLCFKIYESGNCYLKDITISGPSVDKIGVEYAPLHGCVLYEDRDLIFSRSDIHMAFAQSPENWGYLAKKIDMWPTIFWGYAFEDSGAIQAFARSQKLKEKWIVLLNPEPFEVDYWKDLDFFVLKSNTEELLDYIIAHAPNNKQSSQSAIDWGRDAVPSFPPKGVMPIERFFDGEPPSWDLIFNDKIPKTSHFDELTNLIYSQKNIIITGMPACGKTTLMMQVASSISFKGHKLIFSAITSEKAQAIVNKLKGDSALVFIDDLAGNIGAFKIYINQKNIQVIGFERESDLSIIKHLTGISDDDIYNVSNISNGDITRIYSKLPPALIKTHDQHLLNEMKEEVSIFEFITYNIRHTNLHERYRKFLFELQAKDRQMLDAFLVICYVHSCRTHVSFDMLLAYFQENANNSKQIYGILDQLGCLIGEYDGYAVYAGIEDNSQDCFIARSTILAETVIKVATPDMLKNMISSFYCNVSVYQICDFDKFKYKAFDARIMTHAFISANEGEEFYNIIYDKTRNPFVLQQAAIFLKNKKEYSSAFHYIERARILTNYKVYAITNTYAVILFEANIEAEESANTKSTLVESMETLALCYRRDSRKLFHALAFSDHALRYWRRYSDDNGKKYLFAARDWLSDELKNAPWNSELKRLSLVICRKLISIGE